MGSRVRVPSGPQLNPCKSSIYRDLYSGMCLMSFHSAIYITHCCASAYGKSNFICKISLAGLGNKRFLLYKLVDQKDLLRSHSQGYRIQDYLILLTMYSYFLLLPNKQNQYNYMDFLISTALLNLSLKTYKMRL
jgi:hypothetical protein